jgi:hypothetical protein
MGMMTLKNIIDRVMLLIWIILLLLGQYFHESWRDEWQQYQIGITIDSVADLLRVSALEVTGPIWFIAIKILFGNLNFEIFKWCLTIFYIWAGSYFWIKSDLNIFWKFILFFNYFTLFEYGIITRSYSLQLSLFFILFTLRKRKKKIQIQIILIFIICSLNLYGIYLIIIYLMITIKDKKNNIAKFTSFFFGSLTLMYIIIFSHGRDWGINYADNPISNLYRNLISFIRNIITIILPVPDLSKISWGESFLGNHFNNQSTISIFLVLIFVFYIFVIKPLHINVNHILIIFGLYTIHNLFIFAGALRHIGFLYFLIIFILIIQVEDKRVPELRKFNKIIVLFLLLTQYTYGMFFLYNDITKPFSSGMELSKTYDSESLTIAYPDWIGISYLGYSKSSAYFPQGGRYSDHWILTKSRLGLVGELPIFPYQ